MNKLFVTVIIGFISAISFDSFCQEKTDWKSYAPIIRKNIFKDYKGMFKPAGGSLKHPFITPGSSQYADVLWDWDSWLSNIALKQILLENGTAQDRKEAVQFEQGCILNFLNATANDGWMPIFISRNNNKTKPQNIYTENMHKPCIAQHAAFLTRHDGGNVEWLRDQFYGLQRFVGNYKNHHRNRQTGLYYWQNDFAIGVDNDPSTYYRPPGSSASIYLNCLMYKELKAMAYLSTKLNLTEIAPEFEKDAEDLKNAIQKHCWDEKDGFYYSVDLNLVPLKNESAFTSHSGAPREWDCIIQRIGSWSGFLSMWSGIATPAQARRIVNENYNDARTFNAPYGVRSLSKLEKMYSLKASGNPSSWLGPVWGVSNYLTWRGLVTYGFNKEAKELAIKTVKLFGEDFKKTQTLHEYYQPENGQPILNPGFQNWNYLVLNMLSWLEGKQVVAEF